MYHITVYNLLIYKSMYSNIAIYYCVSQTFIVHPSIVRYIMICIDVFVKGAGEYGYDMSRVKLLARVSDLDRPLSRVQ